ncbi:MAG: hypothetical protein KDK66_09615 [Deltaproteobacteria bacterium]|nr:hypothetical protein [Deltaproteobacteria bacterium]
MQALALNTNNLTFSFLQAGPQEICGQSLIQGGSFDFVKLSSQPQIQLLLNSLSQINLPQDQVARSLGRQGQMLLQLGAKIAHGLKNNLSEADLQQGLEKALQKNSLEKDLSQALEIKSQGEVNAISSTNNSIPSQDLNKPVFQGFLSRLNLQENLQTISKKWNQAKSQVQSWVFACSEKSTPNLATGRWMLLGLSGSVFGAACLISSWILHQ